MAITVKQQTAASVLTPATGKDAVYVESATGSLSFKDDAAAVHTIAESSGKLSQFAATTSAELAGVISDETGSGALVFGTSPTIASPTLTGTVTVPTPSNATDVANKSYVDGKVAGLSWKQSVRAATTSAHTLATDYENADVIDGVTLATGDRVLIKDQASGAENGIYTVNASGAPTRATDADTAAEMREASVYVEEGTTNADTQWVCTTNAPITLGSTALAFAQLTSGGSVTDATISTSDITTNNSSTSKHGWLKKLNNDATYYMDGTGNWSVPAGGGGGSASPTTTNLVRWYKADAGITKNGSNRVSAWADQSSAASNLSQSTSGNQPLWTASVLDGMDGIYFDSARSDNFPLDLSFMPSADWTVMCVVWPDTTADHYIFGAATGGTGGQSLKVGIVSSQLHLGFWGDDVNLSPSPYSLLGPHALTFLRKGTSGGRKIRQDSLYATFTAGTLSGIAGGGVLGGAIGTYWKGYIMEVLMYSAALSIEDQATNLAYLAGRYPSLGTGPF
jgi:hypothetical protein